MSGTNNASRRPYRKASEYSTHQYSSSYNATSTKPVVDVQQENENLRERLHAASQRMEQMEVEFSQSKEYLESSLDITTEKLNRAIQQHKLLKSSYSELQAINYDLEQKLLKINQLENEKLRLTHDVHDLTNKLTDARTFIHKLQSDNDRLKNDCNIAVQLLECKDGSFRRQPNQQPPTSQLPRDIQEKVKSFQIDQSQYNEYINPHAAAESSSDSEDEILPSVQNYNPHHNTQNQNDMLRSQLGHVLGSHNAAPQQNNTRDTYSGKFAEKKLVKPNYPVSSAWDQKQGNANHNDKSSPRQPQPQTDASTQNSPWQRQQQPSTGTSPWQLASTNQQTSIVQSTDTYSSSAFAYGANPTMSRRPHSANTHSPIKSQSQPTSMNHVVPPLPPQSNSNNNHSLKHEFNMSNHQRQRNDIFAAEEDLVMTLKVDDSNKSYYEMKKKNEQLIHEAKNLPQVDLLNLDETAAVTSPLHGTDSISLEFDPLSSFQPSISGKILDSLSLLQDLESPQHNSSIPTEIVPPPPDDFANSPAKILPNEDVEVRSDPISILDLPLDGNSFDGIGLGDIQPAVYDNNLKINIPAAANEDGDISHKNLHSGQSDDEKVVVEELCENASDEAIEASDIEEEVLEQQSSNEEYQNVNHSPLINSDPGLVVDEVTPNESHQNDMEEEAAHNRRNSLEQAQGYGSVMAAEEMFI